MSQRPRPVAAALAGAAIAAVAAASVAGAAYSLQARSSELRVDIPTQAAPSAAPSASEQVDYQAPSRAERSLTMLLGSLPEAFDSLTDRGGALGTYTYPAPARCHGRLPAVYEGFTWSAEAPGKGGALTVTALVSGPGYGAATLERLRGALVECGASVSSVSPTPGGFTARVQGIEVVAWGRGDVVTVTASDAGTKTAKVAPERVDAALEAALKWTCPVVGPSREETRNPYLTDSFTGLTVPIRFRFPESGFQPERHPVDQLSWLPAEPRELPEYTLITPDGSVVIPEAVDPDMVREPDVTQRSAPVAPKAFESPVLDSSTTIRVDDPYGPGCGWSFLGLTVPEVSEVEVQEATVTAAQAAAASAAERSARTLLRSIEWARQDAEYRSAAQEYAVWQQYQAQLVSGEEAIAAAKAAWIDALSASIPEPTPSAVPTPSPTPAPSLTPSPVAPQPAPSSTTMPETTP